MKKIKRQIFVLLAAIITTIATVVASSACFLYAYQPEEPECLREE